jgi:hypothetical protein
VSPSGAAQLSQLYRSSPPIERQCSSLTVCCASGHVISYCCHVICLLGAEAIFTYFGFMTILTFSVLTMSAQYDEHRALSTHTYCSFRSSHVFHWFMSTNADKSPMDQAPIFFPLISSESQHSLNTPETRLRIYLVDSLTKPSC